MPTWAAAGKVGDFSDAEPDAVPSLYDEANLGVPPKGPYLCEVLSFRAGVTGENAAEPGSPKMVLRVAISEPKGTKKAKFNGYAMYRHLVLNDMFAGRINAALQALMANSKAFAGHASKAKRAAVIKAFWAGKVTLEGSPEDQGGTTIEKIGTWVVPKDGMLIGVNARMGKTLDGDPALDISSMMPYSDAPKGLPAEEEDVEDTEEEPEEAAEGEGDEEVDARAEELDGYNLAKLKTTIKGLGVKLAEYKTMDKDALIEAILDLEFPPEDDAEEPEEEDDAEDDAEEEDDADAEEDDGLDEMDRAELKALNTSEGLGIKVLKSMSDDDLREAVRAGMAAEAPEEEEPEEEEEPPAKPARRGAKAQAASPDRPAARRRGGSKKGDDEPPF